MDRRQLIKKFGLLATAAYVVPAVVGISKAQASSGSGSSGGSGGGSGGSPAKEPPKDLERLNEEARLLYYKEDCEIIDSLNKLVPEGQPKLRAPDMKFNREIGDYAGKRYSVTGESLSEAEFAAHLKRVLPGPEDMKVLEPVFKAGHWMTADAKAA